LTMHFAMGEQFWIVGQLAIDIVMLVLLAILLALFRSDRGKIVRSGELNMPSERLLEEMKQISASLEKNLEEKRELTGTIVRELQILLSDAKDASLRLEVLLNTWRNTETTGRSEPSDTERLKKSARVLSDKGLSRKEIAKRLNIPMGELELMLKL
jgi:nitrate/nitrite-specific signal transduction histidine kinase